MSSPKLRPAQQTVIDYKGGKMGVAAVPGSGKTFTLSHLAARLVEELADRGSIDDQEVLIVTFTNPAVNTFRNRIARLVQQERGLLPYIGYRVRTLHGLAHDIVRMRPGLVGLSESFEIVDDRVTSAIIREMAEGWVRNHAERLVDYLKPDLAADEGQIGRILRRNGVDLVESLAYETIRAAKDNHWEPADVWAALDAAADGDLPLARIGAELYEGYQRALGYRGAVDFADLVRLAIQAIEMDADFLLRLQSRWPYILEDEAQDSSQLQERMLRLLSGDRNAELGLPAHTPNWVRVGDPNQAIFTTFTTADSNLLRAFLKEDGSADRPLPQSGRSATEIIDLANELVRWTGDSPLLDADLQQAFLPQAIEPVGEGDPQPNPAEGFVHVDWEEGKNITPEKEIERVVTSLANWLPDHNDPETGWTVAVLAPENSRGFKVAEALKARGIPYEELLRSTSATRDAATRLELVFNVLADPTEGRRLARLYREVWWPLETGDPADEARHDEANATARALNALRTTEDFLWPGPEGDWLRTTGAELPAAERELLTGFRGQVQQWLEASVLPVDQLVLTISQQLFTEQADLALGHKIAVVLGGIAAANPDYRMPEFRRELAVIAQNERRFLGFDDAAEGYEPRRGVVTVATMHAAKGLEWDRVYLLALNNYSFPAAQPGDSYIAERWFVRDELNLQAETHAQLELAMAGQADQYAEGAASAQARIDYAAERLRLLYVGITRARRDLILMWNMGRFWEQGRRNAPAAALIALAGFTQGEGAQ